MHISARRVGDGRLAAVGVAGLGSFGFRDRCRSVAGAMLGKPGRVKGRRPITLDKGLVHERSELYSARNQSRLLLFSF